MGAVQLGCLTWRFQAESGTPASQRKESAPMLARKENAPMLAAVTGRVKRNRSRLINDPIDTSTGNVSEG